MIQLKELRLESSELIHIQSLARQSTDMEHLIVDFLPDYDHILPFFQYSKRLLSVTLNEFGVHDLNLLALNKERQELGAKRKVTIYAPELIYLKTK